MNTQTCTAEYDDLPELLTVSNVVRITGWGWRVRKRLVEAGRLRVWKTMGGQSRYYKNEVLRELNGVTTVKERM